ERLEPGRLRDALALDEPARRLDLRLRRHREPAELVRRLDLRQHDDVRSRRTDEREVLPGAAIHADGDGRGAPLELAQRAFDTPTRRVLAVRGDPVLEVEDHLVGGDPGRLRELPLVVAGDGQARAPGSGHHGATLYRGCMHAAPRLRGGWVARSIWLVT